MWCRQADRYEPESTERVIVIGGGVGPMAGVELHRAIIDNTSTDGTDQSHLAVIHLSISSDIADRTDFLLGRTGHNPADSMARVFRAAAAALRAMHRSAVGAVPCNTFHAPVIFSRFLELLAPSHSLIEIVNMIDETIDVLGVVAPEARRVGVLSTTGTRNAGLYSHRLASAGVEAVECPAWRQRHLHDAIYNRTWGLKAVSPPSTRALKTVDECAATLAGHGAEAIVAGCTELGYALNMGRICRMPVISPTVALARALIRRAAPDKLKPWEAESRSRC